jgi:hypothetical protein
VRNNVLAKRNFEALEFYIHDSRRAIILTTFIKKKQDKALYIRHLVFTTLLIVVMAGVLFGCGEKEGLPSTVDITPSGAVGTPKTQITPTNRPAKTSTPTPTKKTTPTVVPTEGPEVVSGMETPFPSFSPVNPITPVPPEVPTLTPTPTCSPTPMPTGTPTPTATNTPTNTPSPKPTKTPTLTPTFTPTPVPLEVLEKGATVWLNRSTSYYDKKDDKYLYAGTASKDSDARIINTENYPYVNCVINNKKVVFLYWPDLSYTALAPTPTFTPTPKFTPTPGVKVPTPTPHTPEHDYESYKTEFEIPPSLPKVPKLNDAEATINRDINYLESEDAVYEYDIYTYPDGSIKEEFQWLDKRNKDHSVEIHYANGIQMLYWNQNPSIYRLILKDGVTIDVNATGTYPTEVWFDTAGKKMYDISYRKVDYASSRSDARYVFNHLEKRIKDYTTSSSGERYTLFVDKNLNVVSGFEGFKFAYEPGKVEWSNEWSIYYFNARMADGRNLPFFKDLKTYY